MTRPVYTKTPESRMAGVERRLRFLERRSQIPEGATGGGGIQFDTTPQEGGFLDVTTTEGNFDLIQNAPDSDMNLNAVETINVIGEKGVLIRGEGDSGVIIRASGDGNLLLIATGGSDIQLTVTGGGFIHMGLSSTDPGVVGALWNDGGTVKVSI
jgi:hypothetical protein